MGPKGAKQSQTEGMTCNSMKYDVIMDDIMTYEGMTYDVMTYAFVTDDIMDYNFKTYVIMTYDNI